MGSCGVSFNSYKIRARVMIGGAVVETPFVLAFNVRKARGQLAATFSCSLKMRNDEAAGIGAGAGYGSICEISAGVGSTSRILTGIVSSFSANPCPTDAGFVIINAAGKDMFALMEGQTITRRASPVSMERFGVITGVVRQRVEYVDRFPFKVTDGRKIMESYNLDDHSGRDIVGGGKSVSNVGSVQEGSAYMPTALSAVRLPSDGNTAA